MTDLVGIGKAAEPFSKGAVGLMRRLFGPVSDELGQLLADRVRKYRSENLNAVIEPVAEEIGSDDVLELPLRFAIPFIEHASREDHEVLREMWSNLLKDAASGVDEEHHLVLRVLSSLTPRAVGLLDYIVGDFHRDEDWYSQIEWHDDWEADLKKFFEKQVEPLLHYGPDSTGDHVSHANLVFEFEHAKPFWVFQIDLPLITPDIVERIDSGSTVDDWGQVIAAISLESAPLQILEREGLIVRRRGEFALKYCQVEFTYAAATRLGVDLVAKCQPDTEGRVE